MRRKILFFVTVSVMLTGCITDKEIGQSALMVMPAVFLVSLGFQYLFFRLWKQKWPDLAISWFPNFVFSIALVYIAIFFGRAEVTISFGCILGTSYLSILLILTRIWLLFNHSKTFTWASIVAMSLFILPAFPMVAGITKGTPFLNTYVLPLWGYAGGWRLIGSSFETTGLITALIFFTLLIEVWLKTRKKADNTHLTRN